MQCNSSQVMGNSQKSINSKLEQLQLENKQRANKLLLEMLASLEITSAKELDKQVAYITRGDTYYGK